MTLLRNLTLSSVVFLASLVGAEQAQAICALPLPSPFAMSDIGSVDAIGQVYPEGHHYLPEPFTHMTFKTQVDPSDPTKLYEVPTSERVCRDSSGEWTDQYHQRITDVNAPGAVRVQGVSWRTLTLTDGSGRSRQSFTVRMQSMEGDCDTINIRIGHLLTVNNAWAPTDMIERWNCSSPTLFSAGNWDEAWVTDCNLRPEFSDILLDSGQNIGTIGDGTRTGCSTIDTRGVEVQVTDTKETVLFADLTHYSSGPYARKHAICPSNVFGWTGTVPIGGYDLNNMSVWHSGWESHVDPARQCGVVGHDRNPSTLATYEVQGNWFSAFQPLPSEEHEIQAFLGPTHNGPNELMFSMGPLKFWGINTSGQGYTFPVNTSGSGRINRPFDQLTSGITYCYDNLTAQNRRAMWEMKGPGGGPGMPVEVRPTPDRILVYLYGAPYNQLLIHEQILRTLDFDEDDDGINDEPEPFNQVEGNRHEPMANGCGGLSSWSFTMEPTYYFMR
jgi:hypothetical protein